MKMWRRVVIVQHVDHNPKKSAYLRHLLAIPPFRPTPIERLQIGHPRPGALTTKTSCLPERAIRPNSAFCRRPEGTVVTLARPLRRFLLTPGPTKQRRGKGGMGIPACRSTGGTAGRLPMVHHGPRQRRGATCGPMPGWLLGPSDSPRSVPLSEQ
jgi:hypothetical protein